MQFPFGAGDGNVKQPPFFFQFQRFGQSPLQGEQTFLQPHQKNGVVFESLGRVDRHQRDFVVGFDVVIQVGKQ